MYKVDLIISFDVKMSPLRRVQRSGRTGRQRSGTCVVLVMEGAEYEMHLQAEKYEKSALRVLNSPNLTLCTINHRLLPRNAGPEVRRIVSLSSVS
jgi:ATP-dependent DNA helicase MPH1